ncbi:MAG TPA: hypothetical protein VGD81_04190 [Opitutaceae bacterium]
MKLQEANRRRVPAIFQSSDEIAAHGMLAIDPSVGRAASGFSGQWEDIS